MTDQQLAAPNGTESTQSLSVSRSLTPVSNASSETLAPSTSEKKVDTEKPLGEVGSPLIDDPSSPTRIAFVTLPRPGLAHYSTSTAVGRNLHVENNALSRFSSITMCPGAGERSRSSLHAVPLNRQDGSYRSTGIIEATFTPAELEEWKWAKYFPGSTKYQFPLKGKALMWSINAVGGLAILYYGYDQGVMAGVVDTPNFKEKMGVNSSPQTARDSAAIGGIVAIYYLGTLIGGLMAGCLADRIGRIKTMIFGSIWAIVGAALQTSAMNISWMMAARVIAGIGTGHLNAVVPVWSAEVSKHDSRGAILGMEFFLNIAGLCTAYWLEYGLRDGNQSFRWRFPIAFQLVFVLILIVVLNFFPESPRWLAKMGKEDEAREVLARLRTENADIYHPEVEVEMADIMEVVQCEKKSAGVNHYWNMLFKADPSNIRRRTWLTIGLQIMQEFVGIGVVTVYAPTVFAQAGYSDQKASLLSGINNLVYMFSVLIAVFTLDRFGRRPTLYVGAVLMGTCLILGGVSARYATDTDLSRSTRLSWGASVTFFTFLYTSTFGATWLVTPWLIPTEIMPLATRAKGGALSVLGWSVGNGVVTEITPFLFNAIGWWTFILFGLLNFACLPIIYFVYPETAGKPLEQISILFISDSIFTHTLDRDLKALQDAHPETYSLAVAGDPDALVKAKAFLKGDRSAEKL